MPRIFTLIAVAAFSLLGFYFYIVLGAMISPPVDYVVITPSENAYSPKMSSRPKTPKSNYTEEQIPGLPKGASLAVGARLYKANCASCHAVQRKLTGPALGGAWTKYMEDKDFLYEWVRNAPKMIEEGHPKAVALSEWGTASMIAFPSLNDAQIASILAYAEAESTRREQRPTVLP